jgi:hypothetical protein
VTRVHPPAEGWYRDPFGAHEARWFSEGIPTALVRDGQLESHDPPPPAADAAAVEPEELPEQANAGSGLLRADEAESGEERDGRTPGEAALDAFPLGGPLQ